MICKNCGAQMDDSAIFCSACGHEYVHEPVKEPTNIDTAYQAAKDRLSNQILTWGILSIAFASTFYFSLIGLIFSFVTKSKVKQYTTHIGPVSYKSKVGRDLGKAGFIVGLILTIIYALYLFILFIGILGIMLA
jgi:uncharacterized membrane protein YvbJ